MKTFKKYSSSIWRLSLLTFMTAACTLGSKVKKVDINVNQNRVKAQWLIGDNYVNVIIPVNSNKVIGKTDSAVTLGGNVVVVWDEKDKSDNHSDIFAQMFYSDGSKMWDTGRLPVSVFRGNQTNPKVAPAPDGGFFVVWQSDSAGKNNINIWCQKFIQKGRAAWLTPVPVCAFSANQVKPVITPDEDGSILIVWEDYRHGNADIYGQRVEQDGSFTGPEDGVAIAVSPGNQTGVEFKFDKEGNPSAISWYNQRGDFVRPIKVETDISKIPIPEPGMFLLFFPAVLFLFNRQRL